MDSLLALYQQSLFRFRLVLFFWFFRKGTQLNLRVGFGFGFGLLILIPTMYVVVHLLRLVGKFANSYLLRLLLREVEPEGLLCQFLFL